MASRNIFCTVALAVHGFQHPWILVPTGVLDTKDTLQHIAVRTQTESHLVQHLAASEKPASREEGHPSPPCSWDSGSGCRRIGDGLAFRFQLATWLGCKKRI